MQAHRYSRQIPTTGLSFFLLAALLGVLWLAGGASRADALGQAVVRSVAWGALILTTLFGERPAFSKAKTAWILLLAAAALPLAQLAPLPSTIWQALPGRDVFTQAAGIGGIDQPWRSWAIVPGGATNAAFSMIVPIVVLALATGVSDVERARLPAMLLGFVSASMLVGLLQFSGAGFDNPFINDTVGQVSGSFANRNHFALFMALGCLLAPVWTFSEGARPERRAPAALGLVLLFALMILASGSRAGILLGILALGLGLALVRESVSKALRRAPRWVFPALIISVVGMMALFVLLSVAADRAVSIHRVFTVDAGQDMRRRGLPTVLAMIRAYFPMGAGFGSFDQTFRIHEPFGLLAPTYFNHAHNDFLEIVLEGGLPGLILLLCALIWWVAASWRAWRAGGGRRSALPKLGSAMLFLIIIASVFDYPARTPMMMAVIVLAALWLSGASPSQSRPALPGEERHL